MDIAEHIAFITSVKMALRDPAIRAAIKEIVADALADADGGLTEAGREAMDREMLDSYGSGEE